MTKPQPPSQPIPDAKPILLAGPRPHVDPVAAAREIAARYPIVMARLTE